MDNKEIGKRIKYIRDKRDMSLQEVAELTGVARSTIQRYEQGMIGKIKLPVIESIARALNVRPDWIVGKTDIMEIPEQPENTIYSYFNLLNNKGKKAATEQVRLLTLDEQYTCSDNIIIENKEFVLNAAHADDYSNAPDELKQQEEDILDDDNFGG